MTWGEAKLIALQTMFANEGVTLTADDSNEEYINAMPGKANEAMDQIILAARPLLKQFEIELSAAAEEETREEGKLTLPIKNGVYRLALDEYMTRYKALDRGSVMEYSGGTYGPAEDWALEGDRVLVLPGCFEGTLSMWYEAYPKKITAETEDAEELELPRECAELVPLYIAAELYKEDDLSMSTIFRNEFEDGLIKVKTSYAASGGGFRASKKNNTTGWW